MFCGRCGFRTGGGTGPADPAFAQISPPDLPKNASGNRIYTANLLLGIALVAAISVILWLVLSRQSPAETSPDQGQDIVGDSQYTNEIPSSSSPIDQPDLQGADLSTQTKNIVAEEQSNIIAPLSMSTANAAQVADRFYTALSQADGLTANLLVVPANRSRANFRAENISSFFGSLKVPLVIDRIDLIDINRARVFYRFTHSRTECVGQAMVTTRVVGGERLIDSISTGGGC